MPRRLCLYRTGPEEVILTKKAIIKRNGRIRVPPISTNKISINRFITTLKFNFNLWLVSIPKIPEKSLTDIQILEILKKLGIRTL